MDLPDYRIKHIQEQELRPHPQTQKPSKWYKVAFKDTQQMAWVPEHKIPFSVLVQYKASHPEHQNQKKYKPNMGQKNSEEKEREDGQLSEEVSRGNYSSVTPQSEMVDSEPESALFGNYQPFGCRSQKKKTKSKKIQPAPFLNKKMKKEKNIAVKQSKVIRKRTRDLQPKDYKALPELAKQKYQIDLSTLKKKVQKAQKIQALVVKEVLSTYQIETQKYYLVQLVNGEKVMVSEVNMNRYFPYALSIYYEKLVNLLTTSVLIPK